ncbi:MAG: LamG domain-containing protein, partial [Melioribacteraceae bacterium]|nr:LamG domain-containing protein [Melioribacteraceae bacterium]
MKMIKYILAFLLLMYGAVLAQTSSPRTVVFASGSRPSMISDNAEMTAIIGQTFVGEIKVPISRNRSSSVGFWGILKMPPLSPILFASDGDHPDRVELTWQFDPLSPPPDDGYKVFRRNSLLGTISKDLDAFQDFQVTPGRLYEYQLLGVNEYGDGGKGEDIGFVNPNGVITGNVKTENGSPGTNVEIYLDPITGKSLSFNGNSSEDYDYLEIPNSLSTPNFTIEFWIKTEDKRVIDGAWAAPLAIPLFDADSAGNAKDFTLALMDSKIAFWDGEVSKNTQGNISVTDGKWHHIAVTRDATENSLKIYVDGELDVQGEAGSNSLFDVKTVYVGGNVGQKKYFIGSLDDVRFWNYARSPSELEASKMIAQSAENDNLLAYYKFDEGFGDYVFDITNNRKTGKIIDAVWNDDHPGVRTAALTDEDGNYKISGISYGGGTTFSAIAQKNTPLGSALYIASSENVSILPQPELIFTDKFTFEAWIFAKSFPGSGEAAELFKREYAHFVDSSGIIIDTTYTERIRVLLDSFGNIAFHVMGSDNASRWANAQKVPELNKWYHVTATYSADEMDIMIHDQDGNLVSTPNPIVPGAGIVSPFSNTYYDTSYFKSTIGGGYFGYLDEVRLWNKSKTNDEVKETLFGDANLDTTGLVSYLKFNENVGSFAADASIYGNNGEIKTSSPDGLWTQDLPFDDFYIHEFNPRSKYLTLNESNTAKDDIDFIDVSLINVTGYVKFANTSCYQDSVEILVDGKSAQPQVFTDENGKFIVEIEPGARARLTPKYSGHTFEYMGRGGITTNYYDTGVITGPLAGIVFENTTTRNLEIKVFGGSVECPQPIQPESGQIIVKLNSVPFCFERVVKVAPVDDMTYRFNGIPPQVYTVTVEHPDAAIQEQLRGFTVSLRDTAKSKTFNLIYRSEPEISIVKNYPTQECGGSALAILNQNTEYELQFQMVEEYYNRGSRSVCYIDSGIVTISDGVSDIGDTSFTYNSANSNHLISYKAKAGVPNIISPYEKETQIFGTDNIGRKTNVRETKAVVIGKRPRETTFITTSTPEQTPWLILRDPPGDKSYAFVEEGTVLSREISFGYHVEKNEGDGEFVTLGPDISISKGAVVSIGTEIELIAEWKNEQWTGTVSATDTSVIYSHTVTERISTQEYPMGGDVFYGASINVVYGLTDVLELSTEEGKCFNTYEDVFFKPGNIKTKYVFSEYHIKNSLIPQLDSLLENDKTPPDSLEKLRVSRDRWKQLIAWNNNLKNNTADSKKENISFDAGSKYEYTKTTDTTLAYTVSYQDAVFNSNSRELGATAAGFGGSVSKLWSDMTIKSVKAKDAEKVHSKELKDLAARLGWKLPTPSEETKNQSRYGSYVNSFGYVFEDDDAGDYFSIDVTTDTASAWPVFNLVSGRSSSPWEVGTQPRDEPRFGDPPGLSLTNVPANEQAVFSTKLRNLSQSEETRPYKLSVLNDSNPDGAIVRVNGVVPNDMLFILGFKQDYPITITIDRGPRVYEHKDIKLIFYSPGDFDYYLDGGRFPSQVSDTLTLSAYWLKPCSDVNINSLDDDWLLTSSDEDILNVTLDGYNKWDEELMELKLQYRKRPLGKSNSSAIEISNEKSNDSGNDEIQKDLWIDIDESKIDTLNMRYTVVRDETSGEITSKVKRTQSYISTKWNTEFLDDGFYELRAVAVCSDPGVFGYSAVLKGIINKMAPALVGKPEPSDGILGVDDQISFTFDDYLDCSAITKDNFYLIDKDSKEEVDFDFTCIENQILFNFNSSLQNKYLENRRFVAVAKDLRDIYGNIQAAKDSAKVEFFVNRNSLEWVGGDIDVVKFDDEAVTIKREIKNTSGNVLSFDINDYLKLNEYNDSDGKYYTVEKEIGDWIKVTPTTAEVQPLGSIEITFEFNKSASHGEYTDTLFAASINGYEPIIIRMENLCHPPDLEVKPESFEFSMTIVGNVFTDGKISTDLCDVVYAFVGDELRGKATIQYFSEIETLPSVNPNQFFMTVYSNSKIPDNETIVLRIWDASQRRLLTQSSDYMKFGANRTYGAVAEPKIITTSNLVVQENYFKKGWNWFSPNLTNTDLSINYVLSNIHSDQDNFVKSVNPFADQSTGTWMGTLSDFNSNSMYMIRLSRADTLQYFGSPVDLDTSSIIMGEVGKTTWNWIGYHPSTKQPISEAIKSLNPNSEYLIKDQQYFSTYVENLGWIGSLTELVPGNGYKLRIAGKDTLSYSEYTPALSKVNSTASEAKTDKLMNSVAVEGWEVNPNDYEFNMNIVAQINEGSFAG